jgi:small-conductance mechanosensitive channel
MLLAQISQLEEQLLHWLTTCYQQLVDYLPLLPLYKSHRTLFFWLLIMLVLLGVYLAVRSSLSYLFHTFLGIKKTTSTAITRSYTPVSYFLFLLLYLHALPAHWHTSKDIWHIYSLKAIHSLTIISYILSLLRLVELCFFLIKRHIGREAYDQLPIFSISQRLVKGMVVILALILAPRSFTTFDISPYLKSLSIGGGTMVAIVAVASKDLIANFFGALVIVLTRPFRLGDYIRIEDIRGKVVDIDLRATTVVTPQGVTVYIPNARFALKHIHNYGKTLYMHCTLTFTLPQHHEQAVEVLLADVMHIIGQQEHILHDKTTSSLGQIADTSLSIEVYLYFTTRSSVAQAAAFHQLANALKAYARTQKILLQVVGR